MKKVISFILISVLMLTSASCMKVQITLPERNLGGNSAPVQGTAAPEQNVPAPEITTAPPVVVTTAPPVVITTVPPVVNTTSAPVVITTAPAETTTAASVEITTAPAAQKTPLEMSKEELLAWFNDSINGVKDGMPGFKRAKLTTVSDIKLSNQAANTLVGFVKGALLSEEVEEKTAVKGQSCAELMSPDGERYVSQLTMADIKDITVTSEGTGYAVTVTLPEAVNPTKTEGAYAKIFNFITVDDVVNTYAPKVGATVERSNIKVTYSGCTAKAVISPEGRVEAYNTYVTCVMALKDATVKKVVTINTDVEITLVSNTDYSEFAY